MKTVRIIPRLDIKGPNLVKGIHLEGLRVLGKPSDFAKYYYENGADEIMFMDVVASLYGRNSLHDIISETARNIFIPLTVGGGLRSIEDIKNVLRAGADKVCLNTAAINNPSLITEAAAVFGSSTIVVAIEAIRESDGRYLAYTDNGREYTGVEVSEWARKVEELGAGELVLTSVDREGTGEGLDEELIKLVISCVNIPVIVHGGIGTKDQIYNSLKECRINAIALSSILHYNYIKNNSNQYNSSEGNYEFLNKKRDFHNIKSESITEIKEYLTTNGIECRL